MMLRLTKSEVRRRWSEVLDRVCNGGARLVIHGNGRDIVAIVPLHDYEWLKRLEDAADRQQAGAVLATDDFVPLSRIKTRLAAGRAKAKSAKTRNRGIDPSSH